MDPSRLGQVPTDPADSGRVLVLGIGNLLCSDDGAGVHAARLLDSDPGLPSGTEVYDGGTTGLSLLPLVDPDAALVIIDAVDTGAPPGYVSVLSGPALHAEPARLSIHEVGTADLLAAARLTGQLPDRTVLVGVQPQSLAAGVDLTPPVAEALPGLVATALDWCRRWSAPQ